MANRYWVGDSGTWNSSSSAHWSATSGGAGGVSVPNSTDDVFFDAASFSGGGEAVTIGAGASCRNLDFTGVDSGTQFNSASSSSTALSIHGDLTLDANLANFGSWSVSGHTDSGQIHFNSGTNLITSNGVPFDFTTVEFNGTATLADDASFGDRSTVFIDGDFDAAGFNMTGRRFNIGASFSSPTVDMGSGTWTIESSLGTIAGAGSVYIGPTATVDTSAVTIHIGPNGIFNSFTVAQDGLTIFNVEVDGGARFHASSPSTTMIITTLTIEPGSNVLFDPSSGS